MLSKSDISSLLENTDFDEYDIREWFREFLKVKKHFRWLYICIKKSYIKDCPEGFLTKKKVNM